MPPAAFGFLVSGLVHASPLRTASRRWRSCSLMTSSAVSPRSSTPHGPPSWRQVMVFMVLLGFEILYAVATYRPLRM